MGGFAHKVSEKNGNSGISGVIFFSFRENHDTYCYPVGGNNVQGA